MIWMEELCHLWCLWHDVKAHQLSCCDMDVRAMSSMVLMAWIRAHQLSCCDMDGRAHQLSCCDMDARAMSLMVLMA